MKKRWLPLLGLLVNSTTTLADVLWMNNGDHLTGTVNIINNDLVKITPPYSSPLLIKQSAIKKIEQNSSISVKKTTSTNDLPRFETEQWKLSGKGDIDVKLKNNDKNANNIKLKGDSELSKQKWRYGFLGEYYYETTDSMTKKHSYRLNPTIDYFITNKWFWRNSLDYDYNMIDNAYLSIDYASGPGYRFWNENKHRFEIITQGGVRKAYWHESNPTLDLVFKKTDVSYPFISLGWDYRQPILADSIELFSKGTYLKYLHQPSPYLTLDKSINLDLGLRYYFNNHLHLSMASELDWDDLWLDYAGHTYNTPDSKEWRQIISLGADF